MAHPTRLELVTSAFGEWIVGFAEPIRFYPIARYATESQNKFEFDSIRATTGRPKPCPAVPTLCLRADL